MSAIGAHIHMDSHAAQDTEFTVLKAQADKGIIFCPEHPGTWISQPVAMKDKSVIGILTFQQELEIRDCPMCLMDLQSRQGCFGKMFSCGSPKKKSAQLPPSSETEGAPKKSILDFMKKSKEEEPVVVVEAEPVKEERQCDFSDLSKAVAITC